LLPGIWAMICIVIYDIDAFRKNDHYGASWALMFVYGIVLISFTYLTSFMFKSPSAAQVFTFLINFLTGFLLMFIAFIIGLI
jgi:hypothetical protein